MKLRTRSGYAPTYQTSEWEHDILHSNDANVPFNTVKSDGEVLMLEPAGGKYSCIGRRANRAYQT